MTVIISVFELWCVNLLKCIFICSLMELGLYLMAKMPSVHISLTAFILYGQMLDWQYPSYACLHVLVCTYESFNV